MSFSNFNNLISNIWFSVMSCVTISAYLFNLPNKPQWHYQSIFLFHSIQLTLFFQVCVWLVNSTKNLPPQTDPGQDDQATVRTTSHGPRYAGAPGKPPEVPGYVRGAGVNLPSMDLPV